MKRTFKHTPASILEHALDNGICIATKTLTLDQAKGVKKLLKSSSVDPFSGTSQAIKTVIDRQEYLCIELKEESTWCIGQRVNQIIAGLPGRGIRWLGAIREQHAFA